MVTKKMNVLHSSNGFEAPELQIWNNAAFDDGDSEDNPVIKASWSCLQSDYVNQSFGSDCSKENQSPVLIKSYVPLKSSVSVKSLKPKNVLGNPIGKSLKCSFEGFEVNLKNVKCKEGDDEKRCDKRNIDMEIEEVEKEISRLSSKLEVLRLEKAEENARSIAMRGRIVPAKFMEEKKSIKISDSSKKIGDSLLSNSKTKPNRRGVSLGPSEICTVTKSRQQGKLEFATPIQSIQSRRKSCFWKLEDINEEKLTKEKGKSLSLSPKSRKTAAKIQAQKQAATTMGCKRPVKKEEAVLSIIQPKKLFKDGEKSAAAKKPLKAGRAVASRYSQVNNQSNGAFSMNDARKRSLPHNEKEDGNRAEKRRASRENGAISCRIQKSESRMKKRLQIPIENAVNDDDDEEEVVSSSSPPFASKIKDDLPKIRTLPCVAETPRDSGPAKRVADLVGRKPYFCCTTEALEEDSVFQTLSFAGEDIDEE